MKIIPFPSLLVGLAENPSVFARHSLLGGQHRGNGPRAQAWQNGIYSLDVNFVVIVMRSHAVFCSEFTSA